MKFTGEMNLGIALLIIGMVITAFIQKRINAFSSLTVNVNPSPDYHVQTCSRGSNDGLA